MLNYNEISEAVEAANWLEENRSYLFVEEHPECQTFKTYLDQLVINFNERIFIEGIEVDGGGFPGDFEILYINQKRWEGRNSGLNTAFLVHELTEGYLLWTGYTLTSGASHVIAEFFETDFRIERELPECEVCPLPSEVIPVMREFEIRLIKDFSNMRHYDIDRLLGDYVKYPSQFSGATVVESK